MGIEDRLRSILVDLYCEKLDKNGYDEDTIDNIVGNNDLVFIQQHIDEFTSPGMIDDFYNNLFFYFFVDYGEDSIFACNEECANYAVSNSLIAYIYKNYITYHYHDPKYREAIQTIAEMRFSILRLQYYENENIAKKMLKCLIHSLAKPEICNNNLELMKQNNEEDIISNFDSRSRYVILSLNEFLRNLFNQYFNRLVCTKHSLKDAIMEAIIWLFNADDVLDTFKKMKLSNKEILAYKKYLRKLIIADIYEDAMNNPDCYVDDCQEHKNAERVAVSLSIYAVSCNKDLSDYTKEQIMYMIYHYIKLTQDEVKIISNRMSSIDNDYLKILKKYNPIFMLDNI